MLKDYTLLKILHTFFMLIIFTVCYKPLFKLFYKEMMRESKKPLFFITYLKDFQYGANNVMCFWRYIIKNFLIQGDYKLKLFCYFLNFQSKMNTTEFFLKVFFTCHYILLFIIYDLIYILPQHTYM